MKNSLKYHGTRLLYRIVPMFSWSRHICGTAYQIGLVIETEDGCVVLYCYWFRMLWNVWGDLGDIGSEYLPEGAE